MNLNRFVLEQQTPTTVLEGVKWWDQLELHNNILERAAKLQKEVDEKRIEKRTGVPTTYPIDSYVLVEYPRTMGDGRGRPPNKLQTIRKGPMKVVGFKDDAYDVFDLVNRKVDTVHVARLYPFYYDPERVDPENVAIRSRRVYSRRHRRYGNGSLFS